MEKTQEQDHVDRWLETAWLQDIPNLDLEVEGIVDRMSGLARRFKRMPHDTLAEHGLSYEEWDVLGILRRAGPPFRRSAGELAERSELSSGAMTNRLDRLEKAGLVKRLPDPNDRRGRRRRDHEGRPEGVGRVGGRRSRPGGIDRRCAERPGEEAAELAPAPPHARVRAPRRERREEALGSTVRT